MASMMKDVAKRAGNLVVKSATPEAWETTAKLRQQYIYTSMDAMPARVAEASKEWSEIRSKVLARDFTVNDIGAAAARALELYAFYVVGRTIGGRSLPA